MPVPVEDEGVIISSIPSMSDSALQTTIETQISGDEVNLKALATAQSTAYGDSVMVLMPGETTPRWLTSDELSAVSGESAAATSAVSLLASVTAGHQVVIAQGASFQMVAFVWTWTV